MHVQQIGPDIVRNIVPNIGPTNYQNHNPVKQKYNRQELKYNSREFVANYRAPWRGEPWVASAWPDLVSAGFWWIRWIPVDPLENSRRPRNLCKNERKTVHLSRKWGPKKTKILKFTNEVLVRALEAKPGWIEIFFFQEIVQIIRLIHCFV